MTLHLALAFAGVLGGAPGLAAPAEVHLGAARAAEPALAPSPPPAPPPPEAAGDAHCAETLARLEEVEARLAAIEAAQARVAAPSVEDGGATDAAGASAPDGEPAQEAPGSEAVTLTGPVVIAAHEVVAEAVSLTGPVDVYGRVLGNAVGMGADVRVHPGGRVEGDAVSLGGRVEVFDGGEVGGDRVALGDAEALAPPAAAAALTPAAPMLAPESIDHLALMGQLRDLARRIAAVLSFAAAGVLVVGFWPRQVDQVAGLVSRRPLWYGFLGGAFGVLLVGGASLLALTIIGIPIGLLLLLALVAGGLLGFVSLGKAIGDRFPGVREQGGWLTFLVGAGLLTAIAFLPWVGPGLIALLVLPALGAALASRFGNREEAPPPR